MIENILNEEEYVFIKAFLTLKDIAYKEEYQSFRSSDIFVKYNDKGTRNESFLYYDEYNNEVHVYSRMDPDKILKINGFRWNEEFLNSVEAVDSSGVDISFEVSYSDELSHLIDYLKFTGFWKEFEDLYIDKYLSNTLVLISQLDKGAVA